MNVKTSVSRLILAVATALITSSPAGADTITIGGISVDDQGQFSSVAGVTTVDFNALSGGTQDFVTGIASYTSVDIFTCATCTGSGDLPDDTTPGARAFGGGDDFTIAFSEPLSYFGLYWGSPDSDNRIQLFSGVTEVVSLTGAGLAAFGVGSGVDAAAYVNFFAGAGESFDRVVITGGTFPFETDNHAFQVQQAVPEPTSLLLFGSGALGLIARLRRHKRS